MKKLLLSLLCLATSLTASAQYVTRHGFDANLRSMYYGVRVGVTSSKLTHDFTTLKAGFNIGGVVGWRLSQDHPVFLETGLALNLKGGKEDYVKCRLPYLEVPLLVKYGIALGTHGDMAVLPFLGPYVAFSAGNGKIIYDSENDGDLKQDAFGKAFKRFDAGLTLGAGFEYNQLYAELGWKFGLLNILKDDAEFQYIKTYFDGKARNSGFFLNVGVNF